MKTLIELQKDLGQQIDDLKSINFEEMKEHERTTIYQKCEYMSKLSKQMINNADVILRTDKMCNTKNRSKEIVG